MFRNYVILRKVTSKEKEGCDWERKLGGVLFFVLEFVPGCANFIKINRHVNSLLVVTFKCKWYFNKKFCKGTNIIFGESLWNMMNLPKNKKLKCNPVTFSNLWASYRKFLLKRGRKFSLLLQGNHFILAKRTLKEVSSSWDLFIYIDVYVCMCACVCVCYVCVYVYPSIRKPAPAVSKHL